MKPNISATICIPVFNEEKCITSTLNSVATAIRNVSSTDIDLLICANACTDSSISVIKDWALVNDLDLSIYDLDAKSLIEQKKNDNIRLTILITKTAGKPNALNNLSAFAKGDFLIFIDADVIIHRDAFALLIQRLIENPGIKGVGGIVLAPEKGGVNLLYRRMSAKMKEFATKTTPYLNGPLYAIRKEAAVIIPDTLIADDAYITMTLGAKLIEKISDALAFQVPPNTYSDYYKRQLRNKLADLQLKQLYGDAYLGFREGTRDNRTRNQREACLDRSERVFKRLFFLQTWILKILDKIAKANAKKMFDRKIIKWYTISSTKQNYKK